MDKVSASLVVKALAAIAVILIASNALLWSEFVSFKKTVESRPPSIISVPYAASTPAAAPEAEEPAVLNASEDPLYPLYATSEKYLQFMSVCTRYLIEKRLLSAENAAALANSSPVVYGGLENASFPLTEARLNCVDGPYQLLLVIDAAQGVLLKQFIIEQVRTG
ncbi:MAG: hypothetical protein AB1626_05990 [Candidatus Micrarchaeota archaeon]